MSVYDITLYNLSLGITITSVARENFGFSFRMHLKKKEFVRIEYNSIRFCE
jgi:hypothetical protein